MIGGSKRDIKMWRERRSIKAYIQSSLYAQSKEGIFERKETKGRGEVRRGQPISKSTKKSSYNILFAKRKKRSSTVIQGSYVYHFNKAAIIGKTIELYLWQYVSQGYLIVAISLESWMLWLTAFLGTLVSGLFFLEQYSSSFPWFSLNQFD